MMITVKPHQDRPLPHAVLQDDQFEGLKLNLGCGFNHLKGCVNVDSNPACHPDVQLDLQGKKWYEWEPGTVDYVCSVNTFEHLPNLLRVLGNIHRVCKPGARVEIVVPAWNHQAAVEDPTHVRYFGPSSWQFWQAKIYQGNTSWYTEDRFNFDLVKFETILDGVANEDYRVLRSLNDTLTVQQRQHIRKQSPEDMQTYLIDRLFRLYSLGVVRYYVYRLVTVALPEEPESGINVYE